MQLILEGGCNTEVAAAAAQAPNKSAFSTELAVRNPSSAVTISTERRLSQLRPCFRAK
jgi:hypothetical protein